MAKASKIEWTDATFNPWIGCEKIAPECDNCYAATRAKRVGEPELWAGQRRRTTEAYWGGPLKWARTLPAELGRRPRVFCASLADVFDNVVPSAWRADLFRLIRATPELDWLLLTKRIGNARRMIEEALVDGHLLTSREPFWPWPNLWLGITAGTQAAFDRDVPKLLATPAAVRFVSMEPLLEPVNVRRIGLRPNLWLDPLTGAHSCFGPSWNELNRGAPLPPPLPPMLQHTLDWLIVGGESGPGARPMHPDWARAIRAQCADVCVPFLFKQWGEWAPGECAEHPATRTEQTATLTEAGAWIHESLTPTQSAELHRDDEPDLFRFGKKRAGRLLDGRQHDEFPRPPSSPPTLDHRGHAAGEGNFTLGAGL